jgi:hypothetical protein
VSNPPNDFVALPTIHELDLLELLPGDQEIVLAFLRDNEFELDSFTHRWYTHGKRKACLERRDLLNQMMEDGGFNQHWTQRK